MEMENTGAQNRCCMLAREQLGYTPGSHLVAWLDSAVFARQRESVLIYIQLLGQYSRVSTLWCMKASNNIRKISKGRRGKPVKWKKKIKLQPSKKGKRQEIREIWEGKRIWERNEIKGKRTGRHKINATDVTVIQGKNDPYNDIFYITVLSGILFSWIFGSLPQ